MHGGAGLFLWTLHGLLTNWAAPSNAADSGAGFDYVGGMHAIKTIRRWAGHEARTFATAMAQGAAVYLLCYSWAYLVIKIVRAIH